MALSLGLAGEGEVGKIIFGALGVRSEQLGFLGVQEGEGLGTRPVSLNAHRDSFNFRFAEHLWGFLIPRRTENRRVARVSAAAFEDGAPNPNRDAE